MPHRMRYTALPEDIGPGSEVNDDSGSAGDIEDFDSSETFDSDTDTSPSSSNLEEEINTGENGNISASDDTLEDAKTLSASDMEDAEESDEVELVCTGALIDIFDSQWQSLSRAYNEISLLQEDVLRLETELGQSRMANDALRSIIDDLITKIIWSQ